MQKLILITYTASLISGCGLSINAQRATNPVIQDWAVPSLFGRSTNIFATKASHRLAMIVDQGGKKGMITCAEPSPDVGEAFASAIANNFSADTTEPKSGINEKISDDYRHAVATQIAPLLYRTQGLQLYRNAISSLCMDMLNDKVQPTGRRVAIPIETFISFDEEADTATNKPKINAKTTGSLTTIDIDPGNYQDLRLFYFIKAVDTIKTEIPVMMEAQRQFFAKQYSGELIKTLKDIQDMNKQNDSHKKDDKSTGEGSSGE